MNRLRSAARALIGCATFVACVIGSSSQALSQVVPASPAPSTSPSPEPLLPQAPTPSPNPFHYIIVPSPVPLPNNSLLTEQDKAPTILEIDLSDRELSAPGPISVRIVTSINVNGVWARVSGRERGIPPTHAGLFEASDQLPRMPFFLKGKTYIVDFVAKTVDGRETTLSVPIFIKK
ncbi:MAG: hypothetical protein GIW98_00955 [Candidatus Eremiobacteraeota bacterium]|nr:hypothetical protein [Candidatus Eremiobacteraeota bacterium]